MKVLLLGGFLGSGKTSVLLRLAQYLVSRGEGGSKVMIIENEIGEVGVDDKLLKSQGLQVRELFAGCACCSGGADLINDIAYIRDNFAPDWLIIESTGVAYPLQIKENVEHVFKVKVGVLCLADAQRWRRLRRAMSDLIDCQLECADWILLNKVDLVEEEQIAAVEADIKTINPRAELPRTVGNKPMGDEIWRGVAEGSVWNDQA